ncbi:MAG: peptidylprolyl isomerase [Candidatus Goldbacteria bacterium]|nr:peptidylprolyl isomerase [Candidatus Goldiibacteriota bacterium]
MRFRFMSFLLVFSIIIFSCESSKISSKKSQPQPVKNSKGGIVESTKEKIAVIETEKGTIKFKFFEQDAPNTVANFISLAEKHFYDGLTFHRYEPGFVIQGGCPYGNGTGGPGYTIKAEFNNRPHLEGTVAMARAQDPDSAGSQFYICLAPAPFLDGKYTVFGQVIEGMDVVHKIRAGDKMKKVYIIEK